MRPIFCGNFEFDARSSELERLFKRYGKVDRVDMKSGYAFIYMDDERDAEYAIRALDRSEFGRKGRRLRVEWTKHEKGGRKSASSRRSANIKPSKTLFVINFPHETKIRDLERHFDPYGKIANVRIRRNFAFVQYENEDDAIKALEATNMSKMLDRVISVEFAARDDNDRRNGHSPDQRGRDRSPDRRRRSPSPYKRERGSPDYGTGSSPPYRRGRGSPEYGNGVTRSPRRAERSSPDYDRARSPIARRERASPDYRDRSRSPRDRARSPAARSEKRPSPDYRDRSRSPRDRSRSPIIRRKERESPAYVDGSQSPEEGEDRNGYGRHPSTSPYRRDETGSDHVKSPKSIPNNPDPRDSPGGEYASPMDDRYRSRSPPARERSQ